jgi:dTDP-glucose 4,6-dehydratase
MDESHPLHPQSPYAAAKVGADKLAESYYCAFGLPVVIVRPFNTYGPRQSPRAVIPTIITQALESSSIRLGSLSPLRDLTFVLDTVAGFAAAATARACEGQTIQLGSGKETSVAELVKMIGSIMNKRLCVVSESKRKRPKASEVERLLASTQKAARLLSWHAEVALAEGLEKTIQWFRAHSDRSKHSLYYI